MTSSFLYILTFLVTTNHGVKIIVDRSFNDDNDRFNLGSLKHWEYGCNVIGQKCACYYKSTYTSDEGSQAKCFPQIPSCQTVISYSNGMQLKLQSRKSTIKEVLFWTLKSDGTENGVWKDFNQLFSLQYMKKKGSKLTIRNLPRPTFDGQLFKVIMTSGECFPVKVPGTITYPFDFTTIFPSQITTQSPTKTTKATTKSTASTTSTIRTTPTSTKTAITTTLKPTTASNKSSISSTAFPHNSTSVPVPTQDMTSAHDSKMNTGIIIALVVVSLIVVVISTTVFVIYCRRRGKKGENKKGSMKFMDDKAVYLSPTDSIDSQHPQTPYNAHNQSIGNPMYIQQQKNNPYNFDNCTEIYASIEPPGNNLYEGIPYYQNDPGSQQLNECYDYAKDTGPVREEERHSYISAFEINDQTLNSKLQTGYTGLSEFNKAEDFYAGIDSNSQINDPRIQQCYTALVGARQGVYAGTNKPETKNKPLTQPGYAPLDASALSNSVYTGINSNGQNNYSALSSGVGKDNYTALNQGDMYTALDASNAERELYETLSEDEKKNGFTHSKYVGW